MPGLTVAWFISSNADTIIETMTGMEKADTACARGDESNRATGPWETRSFILDAPRVPRYALITVKESTGAITTITHGTSYSTMVLPELACIQDDTGMMLAMTTNMLDRHPAVTPLHCTVDALFMFPRD